RIHRRADRACGRPARTNRSAALSGAGRSGDCHARSRSGPARKRSGQSRSLTQLGEKGRATPQLVETQTAQVAQLQSAVKADEALIEAAQVQLTYTKLTSPIDGG